MEEKYAAFNIVFEEKPKRLPPKKLTTKHHSHQLTAKVLEEKQIQASRRRKAQEEARMERIRQSEEDCREVVKTVEQHLPYNPKLQELVYGKNKKPMIAP